MFSHPNSILPSTFASQVSSANPLRQERLSREEAVRILRSTASYLEGRAEVTQNAAREYRLRTMASKYRAHAKLDDDEEHAPLFDK